MDKQIPIEEIRRARRIRLAKWGAGVAVAVAAMFVTAGILRSGVSLTGMRVSEADRGTIQTTVSASGRVAPAYEQIIASPISSKIVAVYKTAGDSVAAGTPLLLLDLQAVETEVNNLADERRMKQLELEQTRLNNHTYLSDLDMKVKVKEMDVNRKRQEVANERRLDSIGSGTGDNVRKAQLAYDTGLLELEQLRGQLDNERQVRDASYKMKELELSIFDKNYQEKQRMLADARILSPRNAVLTYISDNIGQQVAQGEKVAVVADLSAFRLDCEIADGYGDRVGVGSQAAIRVGSTTIPAHVSSVNAQAQNGVISFVVLPDEQSNRLRSGLRADVYVYNDVRPDVVRIANGPYFSGAGSYELFVLSTDGKKLTRRTVELGGASYDYVEVISGVQPGERVIVSDMSDYRSRSSLNVKQ